MLVLHHSSRCDVCLSEYSWERLGKRPYAIACGHIFCSDCLLTNTPPQCPLCRKTYQPNKIKKLHVDKPENIDDHKENDLLQRLAVSWDAPPDQTKDLLSEIDFWLQNRADDACVALRKARTSLRRHRELKAAERDYQDTIEYLDRETRNLNEAVVREKTRFEIQAQGYSSTMDGMAKEIARLTIKVQLFESNAHPFTGQPRNPLPRPPEPIPTDQIPTFEQAISEVGASSGRFSERPLSPYQNNSSEIPGHSGRDRLRYAHDNQRHRSAPHTPASRYVDPHIAATPAFVNDPNPSYATRLAMRTQFDNTNQPLDAYALVEMYTRSYTTGLVRGKELALGRQMTSFDSPVNDDYQRQGGGSGSNQYQPPYSAQPAAAPTYDYEQQDPRARTSNTHHEQQPYSAPTDALSNDRHSHRRQPTVTSIVSSSTSARNSPRPSSRRSRSRSESSSDDQESTAIALTHHYSSPSLANILSNPPRTSRELPRATSPQPQVPSYPNNASATSRHTQQNSSGPISPRAAYVTAASPHPVPEEITPTRDRESTREESSRNARASSPSGHSHMSGRSGNTIKTWGTCHTISSRLTRGSFVELDLLAFRGPSAEDEQRRQSYDAHGSAHDETNASARASFSDGSSEASRSSPSRPVHSMVGVLPRDEIGHSSYYSPGQRQEAMSYHRSPTRADRASGDSRTQANENNRTSAADSVRSPRGDYRDTTPNNSSPFSPQRQTPYYSPSSLDTRAQGGWAPQGPHPLQNDIHGNVSSSTSPHYSANHQSVWGVSSPPRPYSGYPRGNRITSTISLPDASPVGSPYYRSNENGQSTTGSHLSQVSQSPRRSYGNALGLRDLPPNTSASPVSPRNIPVSGSWSQEH